MATFISIKCTYAISFICCSRLICNSTVFPHTPLSNFLFLSQSTSLTVSLQPTTVASFVQYSVSTHLPTLKSPNTASFPSHPLLHPLTSPPSPPPPPPPLPGVLRGPQQGPEHQAPQHVGHVWPLLQKRWTLQQGLGNVGFRTVSLPPRCLP